MRPTHNGYYVECKKTNQKPHMSLISAKLDLTKILGARVLKKDGRTFIEVTDCQLYEGKAGALYLDATLFPTPGGQYGDYRITQDLPKARRDAGERGAILGNGKNRGTRSQNAAPAQQSRPQQAPQGDDGDQIPF